MINNAGTPVRVHEGGLGLTPEFTQQLLQPNPDIESNTNNPESAEFSRSEYAKLAEANSTHRLQRYGDLEVSRWWLKQHGVHGTSELVGSAFRDLKNEFIVDLQNQPRVKLRTDGR